MRTVKRKWIIVIIFISLCVGLFAYVTTNTRIVVSESVWDYFQTAKSYELDEDESLYTATYFRKEGLAPVRIKSINHIDLETREELGTTAYLCYYDKIKNGELPSGFGRIKIENWEEKVIPVDEVKWLNERFCVMEIKEDNEVTVTDCKITYRVWGIFEKTVVGNSKGD